MTFEADREFQPDADLQCGAITGDLQNVCTKTDEHGGRHVEHDEDGNDVYGWREGAHSAFRIHVNEPIPA